MIYILTREGWPFNKEWKEDKTLFQYVNLEYFVTQFLFKDEPAKVHNMRHEDTLVTNEIIDKILSENPDIKLFACDLDCFQNKQSLLSYDEHICKKYPNVFFIFFYHELDLTLIVNENTKKLSNAIYVLNSFNTSNPDLLDGKVFPYYLMNAYTQKYYDRMRNMYRPNELLRKCKKYNFLNGVHKPHRFAAYQLIKKYDMLKDGFFSYLDYPRHSKDEGYIKQTADFLDMEVNEFKQCLSTFEIPYLLESFEPLTAAGIFSAPFIIPPIYSWQSYISITSETNYIEKTNLVSLSEKSFKAFTGFNIPLIYGQPNLVDYLRHLGFDMFDDLFDNTPTHNKSATFEKLEKNIQTINNMSYQELHNFYTNNLDRIYHNFNNMVNRSKEKQFNQIRSLTQSIFKK